MVLYVLEWLCVVLYGPVWSCMVPYDPPWFCMVIEILSSPTALLSSVRYQILADIESFAFLLKLGLDSQKMRTFERLLKVGCS